MPSADPWAFGLNHLLTLVGFLITLFIAGAGFRSFAKWRREAIEERRIDLAIDALGIAYEADSIFENIRSNLSFSYEWADLKGINDEQRRMAAGPYYAVLKRIENNREYFERIWRLQPRFMAVFGKESKTVFMQVHKARRQVEVSAQMLLEAAAAGDSWEDAAFQKKLKADVWTRKSDDPIAPLIHDFIEGLESKCLPIIAGSSRSFRRATHQAERTR